MPPTARLTSTASNQPLSGHAGQLPDHFAGVRRTGGLDNSQIETVVGKTRQGLTVFDKLNKERRRPVLASRPAIAITQQRMLVSTTQEDFLISFQKVRRDRRTP